MENNQPVARQNVFPIDNCSLDDDHSIALDLMENTSQHVFVTGKAGTGKSTLLNYFRKHSRKKHVVLAPTGLAALQVGGHTVHSFFGFPLRMMVENDPDIKVWGKGHPKLKVMLQMETLVVDEVSMLRADLLDAMDLSLRLNTGNDLPFGGKQLVFIGDLFQLPPVVTRGNSIFDEEIVYENSYFFSSRVFRECMPKIVQLKKIYRQHDPDFIYLLNKIRTGNAGVEDIEHLNERVTPSVNDEDLSIILTSVNSIADQVNQLRLMAIRSESYSFKATIEGSFPEKFYPVSPQLSLKAGAQVMMVKNDLHGRWVNGSIGKVVEVSEDEIKVSFADQSIHTVERTEWEHKSYSWDKSANAISFTVLGTFKQFPIKLAWAITIHKSQGLTFDKIIIDMGKGAFAHGQLYVALSRCRSLGGIYLKRKIHLSDIIVDEAVEAFAGKYRLQ